MASEDPIEVTADLMNKRAQAHLYQTVQIAHRILKMSKSSETLNKAAKLFAGHEANIAATKATLQSWEKTRGMLDTIGDRAVERVEPLQALQQSVEQTAALDGISFSAMPAEGGGGTSSANI
eukprot:gene7061-33091_t